LARRLGPCATETKTAQIKLIDEYINHPNRIVFLDPVRQALRQQRALLAINTLDKALHDTSPNRWEILPQPGAFSHMA
jgi:hypothetical protein